MTTEATRTSDTRSAAALRRQIDQLARQLELAHLHSLLTFEVGPSLAEVLDDRDDCFLVLADVARRTWRGHVAGLRHRASPGTIDRT